MIIFLLVCSSSCQFCDKTFYFVSFFACDLFQEICYILISCLYLQNRLYNNCWQEGIQLKCVPKTMINLIISSRCWSSGTPVSERALLWTGWSYLFNSSDLKHREIKKHAGTYCMDHVLENMCQNFSEWIAIACMESPYSL